MAVEQLVEGSPVTGAHPQPGEGWVYWMHRLQQALEQGPGVPLSNWGLVDRRRAYTTLERLRNSLPRDLEAAHEILHEKERLLSEARAEADQIRQRAEAEARELASESHLVLLAQQRAQEIVQEAERKAERIVQAAESQARQISLRLEHNLDVLRSELREVLATEWEEI